MPARNTALSTAASCGTRTSRGDASGAAAPRGARTSRNTVQKSLVLDALGKLANHPTADAVYDYVHATHPSISKATVYRILGKMSDDNQILRVRINNGADHFDHQVFPHYHVRCTACGRVDDVPAEPALVASLGAIIKQAASESEYCITHAELQFDGLCPACQEKAARLSSAGAATRAAAEATTTKGTRAQRKPTNGARGVNEPGFSKNTIETHQSGKAQE